MRFTLRPFRYFPVQCAVSTPCSGHVVRWGIGHQHRKPLLRAVRDSQGGWYKHRGRAPVYSLNDSREKSALSAPWNY